MSIGAIGFELRARTEKQKQKQPHKYIHTYYALPSPPRAMLSISEWYLQASDSVRCLPLRPERNLVIEEIAVSHTLCDESTYLRRLLVRISISSLGFLQLCLCPRYSPRSTNVTNALVSTVSKMLVCIQMRL